MSAAPAASPEYVQIPGGSFLCPNAIAENLDKLTAAEAFLAVVAYYQGHNGRALPVTDETWARTTRMTPQSRRNAEKGLQEHKLLDKSGRHYDLRAFIGWARHAKAGEKRTVGRGPSKAAEPKQHPACKSGCALAENRASLLSVTSEEKTKPVLPSVQNDVQRGADSAETPASGKAPSGPAVRSADSPTLDVQQPEVKWAKTLAAMRVEFTSAGVELLMRLLTLLWSLADFKGVSDYVLAAAVRKSYVENRRRMTGPGLLVSLVPAVLATWKAEGKPMDAEEEPPPRAMAMAEPYPREPEDAENPSAWMLIRRRLKTRISEIDYTNWVSRSEFGRFEESGDLVVWMPDQVSVEMFDQEYRGLVSEIARQLDIGVKRVIFRMPTKEDLP